MQHPAPVDAGLKRPKSALLRVFLGMSLFVPPVLIALNSLCGNPLSPLWGGMVFVFVCSLSVYTLRESRSAGGAFAVICGAPAFYTWLRTAVALLSSFLIVFRFYSKYFAALLGQGERAGRLSALYARMPLPAPVKAGCVWLLLIALLLVCALGLYAFLTAAYCGKERPDKTRVRAQFLTAVPVALCLLFTVVFFGPMELVAENMIYLLIKPVDICLPLLLITAFGAVLAALPVAFMQKRAFCTVLPLLFGIAVAAYLQGTFFNPNLGTLDGTSVNWRAYATPAIIGAALWLLFIGVQPLLDRLLKGRYARVIPFVSLAVVAMQLVALLSIAPPPKGLTSRYTVSGKDEFTLSADKNVVVFTLDFFDNALFEEIMATYPHIREGLKDFIYFDNTAQAYHNTFPSLNYLLTNEPYDTSIPTLEYVQNAWSGEKAEAFYGMLERENYRRNLFTDVSYAAIDGKNLLGKIDNVVPAVPSLDRALLSELLKLSLYRYAPVAAKADFWTTTAYLNTLAYDTMEGLEPLCLDGNFYTTLQETGLSLTDEHNCFAWYHLQGAHPPYQVGADGQPTEQQTDRITATCGYLVAVIAYLDQMKALGIYDDATVLISADHGIDRCWQVTLLVKEPGQTQAALSVRHAPAAQDDFVATILDCMGERNDLFGTSVFDLTEDMQRERSTKLFGFRAEYPPVPWVGDVQQWNKALETGVHSNVMLEYRYVGDRHILMDKVNREAFDNVIPLYDSFY